MKDLLKTILVGSLFIIGFTFWAFGTTCLLISMGFTIVMSKFYDWRKWGNCWTYAFLRYWQEGGYFIVRTSEDVKFLGKFSIPHSHWVKHLPKDMPLEQFAPVKRSRNKFIPLHVAWHRGRVKFTENAKFNI